MIRFPSFRLCSLDAVCSSDASPRRSVFLEHYTHLAHALADLSATLRTNPTYARLFLHPSHHLSPAEQTALYGGPGATHDPPLRPIPGKGYGDARGKGYAAFADELEALVRDKVPNVTDDALAREYRTLEEAARVIRQSDEHVNFTLLDPPTTSTHTPTITSQLSTVETLHTHLSQRVAKAQQALAALSGGFEWTTRLDPAFSVVQEAAREGEDEDAEGSEEEDEEEDEFEQVAAPDTADLRMSPLLPRLDNL